MERLKDMELKQCFFLLSILCLAMALMLTLTVYLVCAKAAERYPQGGISIDSDGMITKLAEPDPQQRQILKLLGGIQLFSAVLLPAGGLGIAGILFYHLKLKRPIAVLQMGIERIRSHDLNFSLPKISADELGQICAGFQALLFSST